MNISRIGPREDTTDNRVSDKWDAFRNQSCISRLNDLVDQIRPPVMFERRRNIKDCPPTGPVVLTPWSPGQAFPSYGGFQDLEADGPTGSAWMVRIPEGMSPRMESGNWKAVPGLWQNFIKKLTNAPSSLILDITALPATKGNGFLDRWFTVH
jgi:hypothetical protein